MADAGPPSEPVAIPPQEDFPVEWASTDEQEIPWELDLMHFNEVMPPLEGEFWAQFMRGADLAMQHFEMPLQMVAKPFNYWLYTGIFPRIPPEQMPEQSRRGDEVLMATIHRLRERWDEEWLDLPRIGGRLSACVFSLLPRAFGVRSFRCAGGAGE